MNFLVKSASSFQLLFARSLARRAVFHDRQGTRRYKLNPVRIASEGRAEVTEVQKSDGVAKDSLRHQQRPTQGNTLTIEPMMEVDFLPFYVMFMFEVWSNRILHHKGSYSVILMLLNRDLSDYRRKSNKNHTYKYVIQIPV